MSGMNGEGRGAGTGGQRACVTGTTVIQAIAESTRLAGYNVPFLKFPQPMSRNDGASVRGCALPGNDVIGLVPRQ